LWRERVNLLHSSIADERLDRANPAAAKDLERRQLDLLQENASVSLSIIAADVVFHK
jgi:hypothetical protein